MSQKVFALGYHMIGPDDEAYLKALRAASLTEAAAIYRRYPQHLDLEGRRPAERALARLGEPVRLWLLLTQAEGFTTDEALQAVGTRPTLPEETPCEGAQATEDHLATCLTCLRAALLELKAPEAPTPPEQVSQPPRLLVRARQLVGGLVLGASLVLGGWWGLRFYQAAFEPVSRLAEHTQGYQYLPETRP